MTRSIRLATLFVADLGRALVGERRSGELRQSGDRCRAGYCSPEPVVTDSDRVVLAPKAVTDSTAWATVLTRRAGVLERVVVTGTVYASAQHAVPVALDVIDRRELPRWRVVIDSRATSSARSYAASGAFTRA